MARDASAVGIGRKGKFYYHKTFCSHLNRPNLKVKLSKFCFFTPPCGRKIWLKRHLFYFEFFLELLTHLKCMQFKRQMSKRRKFPKMVIFPPPSVFIVLSNIIYNLLTNLKHFFFPLTVKQNITLSSAPNIKVPQAPC